MKALLLIGMQVDLGPGGAAEVPESEGLVETILDLVPKYEWTATVNFWLPASHQMFAANHLWRKPGQPMEVGGRMTTLRHFFCIQNSFGAEPMMGLSEFKPNFTALMGTRPACLPHSAFFDAGKKNDTGLLHFLQKNKVREIHLAGMAVDPAFENTVLDALGFGFEVATVLFACRGGNDELMTGLKSQGMNIVSKNNL